MKTDIHFWPYLAQFLLEWEMFQTKVVVAMKTNILRSVTFYYENRAIYEIERKNIVQRSRPQMTIWSMRIARWIPKTINTHLKYVILIAFPSRLRSVVGIATGYGVDGPGIECRWGRDFPHLSRPALGAHPASCTMGNGSFQWVKSGRVVTLILHPLVVLWSRKSRAIPLLPPWAVRPVQSLCACTRVHFTFTFTFLLLFHSSSGCKNASQRYVYMYIDVLLDVKAGCVRNRTRVFYRDNKVKVVSKK